MPESLNLEVIKSSENIVQERMLGNPDLPIAAHRAEFEHALENNSVVILMARTGSGKTTQGPQYAHEMGLFDEIIVTQPRIVAARTVSERIASEIRSAGDSQTSVGYYTSKEGSAKPLSSQDIGLLTDGKAALKLLYEGKSDSKRLLAIDEVHERNQFIDTLLAIAAERTNPESEQYDPNLKVLIMSATMDTRRLQRYFAHAAPPVINVETPTYPIEQLDTRRSLASMALSLTAQSNKTTLTFLPGTREIYKTSKIIENKQENARFKRPVFPLHGQQGPVEQRKAFKDHPGGSVILATNAAQTSITIPNVKSVVDSGKVRVSRVRYDLVPTGSEGLYLQDAPQSDLLQRMGRAGRTEPGYYVLASASGDKPPTPFEDRPKYAVPSIQSDRVDDLLLNLKATGYELTDFKFLDKPPKEAVDAATKRLYRLGAIDKQGNVTQRGIEMNRLPLDMEYAAMIIFGQEKKYSQRIQNNLLDIAAIMQVGGIFKKSPQAQEWRELLESTPSGETKENDSDFIAQLEAYVKIVKGHINGSIAGYDINKHALSLVEKTRKGLSRKLGVELHKPELVAPSDRLRVLTSINAGQINQIWRKKNKKWSLLLDESPSSFEISDSSVVGRIGELVTGNLFTLCIESGEPEHKIEKVNRILSHRSLEQAAGHLITRHINKNSTEFNPETGRFTAEVENRLDDIVLSSAVKFVSASDVKYEAAMIRDKHRLSEWAKWMEDNKEKPQPYMSQYDIDKAIADPDSVIYGKDIIDNKPLKAWKGGKGQWCETKEIAIKSLEGRKRHLENMPAKILNRELKAEISLLKPRINKLKKQGSEEAKRLMSLRKKIDKDAWIAQAKDLLEAA